MITYQADGERRLGGEDFGAPENCTSLIEKKKGKKKGESSWNVLKDPGAERDWALV